MSVAPQQNACLTHLNSLRIAAHADYLFELTDNQQLPEFFSWLKQHPQPLFILGGGSNLVLKADLPLAVLQVCTKGIEVLQEDQQRIQLRVQAGENWHQLVRWSVERGYFGLENLSLIPGTVGAAPVQNIGAYGVELKDRLLALTAINLKTQMEQRFSAAECQFSYRDSLFKQQQDQWLITSVEFELSKLPQLNLTYGNLQALVSERQLTHPSALQISDLVCEIRQSKLPDPQVLPNTGSFFKNPEIPAAQAAELKARYPNLVSYPTSAGLVKLAAGWMIEQAGWKGRAVGDAAVHQQQALVLVNRGQASGAEVLDLAAQIAKDIQQKFGVQLEIEPNILPRAKHEA